MFRFKQFEVKHQRATMKVGTDAVLLACWANLHQCRNVLEIGTGCGIISLVLAQRFPKVQIDAIDIDEPSVEEAKENFQASRWAEQLSILKMDFVDFAKEKEAHSYEAIISNPPFFINSLKSAEKRKNIARHTDSLTFTNLLKGVSHLLQQNGHFFCILPIKEAALLQIEALKQNLFCTQKTKVRTIGGKPYQRFLLKFSHTPHVYAEDELVIADVEGKYTPEYLEMVKELYLFA